jgi:hypothetical protein
VSKFVKPDVTTLTLADGDVLTVKVRLTYGERSDAFEHVEREWILDANGTRTRVPKPGSLAVEMVIAYLVDWTLKEDGTIVPYRGLTHDQQVATLRALDPDAFRDISDAIDAHVSWVQTEDAEKKTRVAVGAGG